MSKATKLAVDTNAYGDGYIHRATRGLNPARPAWTLAFPFIGEDELTAQDSFLKANAARGFWFKPPGESDFQFVVADEWSLQITDKNNKQGWLGALQATFTKSFNPQPLAPVDLSVGESVSRSIAYLKSQTASRTQYAASILTPADPAVDRHSTGSWLGSYSMPVNSKPAVPYSPVLVTGPLWFPVAAMTRADFAGKIDSPFYSMDGWSGRRGMVNPTPPPDYVTDPASVYADGGVNWGAYFVLGTVNGVKQFRAPIAANATWSAIVDPVPPGQWTFQLITYANATHADADTNRISVGAPWRESERPGDVRTYYSVGYSAGSPQFTGVALVAGATNDINGTLAPFVQRVGFTYQIAVTNETDTEYAWALHPVTGPGAFHISRPSYQVFGGKIKLRLVEQYNGASVAVIGKVWDEDNAADAAAFPDLRIEYRAITDNISPVATATYPAKLDHSWAVTLAGAGAVGRVSLVNINTKRVLGEYTMPTGLIRSFIVPPDQAGQDTGSVYYDGFLDSCYLYDQAVALIAYLTAGEQEAAAKLVDALLSVQASDGSFPFASGQATLYDRSTQAFVRVGAVAWVAYALALCNTPAFAPWFTTTPTATAVKNCVNFILGFMNSIGTINGGKGQYSGGVLDPGYTVPWWSCEHNIDCWWLFDLCDSLYGSGVVNYRGAADGIKLALVATGKGWDDAKQIFWQGGTVIGGLNTPDGMHALDTHTWGGDLLAKWGRPTDTAHSLARADQYYYVTDSSGLAGYTTFTPVDGYPADTVMTVWYEGSFGAVCAWRHYDVTKADLVMQRLIRAQRPDGSFLYALKDDPVNDIHAWPAIIGSAWNVLAASGPGTELPRIFWPVP